MPSEGTQPSESDRDDNETIRDLDTLIRESSKKIEIEETLTGYLSKTKFIS